MATQPTTNSGRFMYADPEVHTFMCEGRQKIDFLKRKSAQEIGAALSQFSRDELADDVSVTKVWTDFQTRINAELDTTWFPDIPDATKFKVALTGPLLEVFQDCVMKATGEKK